MSVSSASPLCARLDHRNKSPVKTRVRSGRDEPTVAANSYTEFESMLITVREISAPPSADQPKSLTTPI